IRLILSYLLLLSLFFFMTPHPPSSTLFPYTTLFRSSLTRNHMATRLSRGSMLQSGREVVDFPHVAGISHSPRSLLGGLQCCRRRSEEHTSELQSRGHLVCRLLLEKKKNKTYLT